jgi:hypothetical protein
MMFDPIQQQAGSTLLRSIANEAVRGALPDPAEPVPVTDRDRLPGWLRRQVRRLIDRFNRVRLDQECPVIPAGRPLGSTAESIQR